MTIVVSAFGWVPEFAQGHVRDLRVRWALEEAGRPYAVEPVDGAMLHTPAYRGWQPFGQVPAYRDDAVELFESGAIVLHIAATAPELLPADPAGRARASAWMFAALNSVEPAVERLVMPEVFHAGEAWVAGARPHAERAVGERLAALDAALGDREWLEGRFTAGDLVMVTVLRSLMETEMLARHPRLDAYRLRGQARPAFARALAAQMADYRAHAPVAG